jgi:hypothetical protein
VVPQSSFGVEQVTQPPLTQVWSLVQAVAQAPQCWGSLASLTQAPPQLSSLPGQAATQAPPLQLGVPPSAAQTVPQAPQSLGSLAKTTQVVPQ